MSRRSSTSLTVLCRACQRQRTASIPFVSSSKWMTTSATLNKRVVNRQKPFELLPPNLVANNPVAHLVPPKKYITTPKEYVEKPRPTSRQLVRLVLKRLPGWLESTTTRNRLKDFGFKEEHLQASLEEWSDSVERSLSGLKEDDDFSEVLRRHGWDVHHLLLSLAEDSFGRSLDGAYLRHFLSYCVSPTSNLPSHLRSHISAILRTTDLSRLPFEGNNIPARTMSRHFHLHIGPTNSGKTYNALKALSKAERGAYAGPLRLLAHEVWERLNLGTVGDLNGKGRQCNLLTGEERRIVDPEAGLVSCTVEMLPLFGAGGDQAGFDVVVIDEIQMLGDEQRGGAWTTAVLGLMAKEVHLCGDETTVELLQRLIGTLGGDTVTVHRYDRLTPLTVADESLNSNFNNVQAGDCIVTFSRTNIFAVKKLVEAQAGKKCAVVYGALPPETRAEQARDFNDEYGRAEVLVASDAVGMGLNLKIKRMVFESMHKWNGKAEVPLALTQIKQIAGRAGRFGLHKTPDPLSTSLESKGEEDVPIVAPDEVPSPGGVVTTLHEADLPLLRSLLPLPLPSIQRATLDIPGGALQELSSLLPSETTFETLLDTFYLLSKTPEGTKLNPQTHKYPIAHILQPFKDLLSLSEMELFAFSPVGLRDPKGLSIFTHLIESYSSTGLVDLHDILSESELLKQLHLVELTLEALPPLPSVLGIGRTPLAPPILISSLPLLETLHKSLVLYIWLSFRIPISFPDRAKAVDYKNRTEVVLDSCLVRLPGLRNKKNSERTKEVEGLWAREKRLKHLEDKKVRWKGWNEPLKIAEKAKWRSAAVIEDR